MSGCVHVRVCDSQPEKERGHRFPNDFCVRPKCFSLPNHFSSEVDLRQKSPKDDQLSSFLHKEGSFQACHSTFAFLSFIIYFGKRMEKVIDVKIFSATGIELVTTASAVTHRPQSQHPFIHLRALDFRQLWLPFIYFSLQEMFSFESASSCFAADIVSFKTKKNLLT